MSAAVEASRAGAKTAIVEERHALGGQGYKQVPTGFEVRRPDRLDRQIRAGLALIEQVHESSVDVYVDTVAWGLDGTRVALEARDGAPSDLAADQVIIATGAYDRPVVFPGWTLPGVLTAGGAHSLFRTQGVIPGERIVMVGTGPLLLAFSAQLHAHGAPVVHVIDSSPFPGPGAMARLAVTAHRDAALLVEGARYLAYLMRHRVPRLYSHAIVRVEGGDTVQSVTVAQIGRDGTIRAGTEKTIEADTVCIGYGLAPSSELTRIAGCRQVWDKSLDTFVPYRDEAMRTSQRGVLVAGDCTRIGGAEIAVVEGRLAGLTAAHDAGLLDEARYRVRSKSEIRELGGHLRFRDVLDSLYPIGDWAYGLADDETVVCRCEDVTMADLAAARPPWSIDPSDIKATTRAGMGYCQGRNCGFHIRRMIANAGAGVDFPSFTARPPAKPTMISTIAAEFRDLDDKPIL
jgi:NADPH-dependent 2,4-dienoyl-CoA reductase/sulfur reductase-like enzyme